MLLWNRKEVYLGFSTQEFGKVRRTLAANHIPYSIRTVSHSAMPTGAPNRMGRFGENSAFANQYYVYVNKRDYEAAALLLEK
jgi:hypothetical protein